MPAGCCQCNLHSSVSRLATGLAWRIGNIAQMIRPLLQEGFFDTYCHGLRFLDHCSKIAHTYLRGSRKRQLQMDSLPQGLNSILCWFTWGGILSALDKIQCTSGPNLWQLRRSAYLIHIRRLWPILWCLTGWQFLQRQGILHESICSGRGLKESKRSQVYLQ